MNTAKGLIEKAYKNNYVFYYISYLCLIFAKTLGMYSGDVEYKIIMVFSMFFLALKYCFTKYTKKEVIILGLALGYAAFIYLKTGYITFTITVFALGAIKDIDVNHLLGKALFIKLICAPVLIFASIAGIVENFVKDQYVDGLTYSFGFHNPNDFMINIFMIVALLFFLSYKKITIIHFLLSAYAFYVVYSVTNSKTGMLLGMFMLLIFLCLKLVDKFGDFGIRLKKLVSCLLIPTSLLCFIGTFLVSVFFDVNKSIFFKLDQMVSGRLKIQHQYWLNYGFSILGKDLSRGAARWDGVQINNGILDSNYWCSFYKYGFITVMFFIACLVFASYYYYKKKQYNLVIILNVLCLYGLMEDFLISSVVNPFLLLVAYAVYNTFLYKENEVIT